MNGTASDHPGRSVAADHGGEPVRTVLLLRHARSTANGRGILAGRSPGVGLDEAGTAQAAALVDRLAGVPLARIVSSPIQRCRDTLAPLSLSRGVPVDLDGDLAEVDYGEWTGRPLKDLAGEPLWRTVQAHPSAAVFPAGEGLAQVSARAVGAVRRLLADTGGDGALLVCSHGDVIKAVLADALGLHLDQFQRIAVSPGSISAVRYTEHRPFVHLVGDTGSLPGVVVADQRSGGSDAVPGGGDATSADGGASGRAATAAEASDSSVDDD